VGLLVDALALIPNVSISSVIFDINDKTQLQSQARTLAFNDAKTKANDYTSFAGMRLGPVVKVDDSIITAVPVQGMRMVAMSASSSMDTNTEIPVGMMDVTYKTVVTFSIL
jgi:uncharacterized protein YggE